MINIPGIGRHQKIRRLLSAYKDAEVSAREAALVESHLVGCSECREDLESLRVTIGVLHNLPVVELPRTFALAREPEPLRERRTSLWTAGLATSAAAALLLVLVVGDAAGLLKPASTADMQEAAPVPAAAAAPAAESRTQASVEQVAEAEAALAPVPAAAPVAAVVEEEVAVAAAAPVAPVAALESAPDAPVAAVAAAAVAPPPELAPTAEPVAATRAAPRAAPEPPAAPEGSEAAPAPAPILAPTDESVADAAVAREPTATPLAPAPVLEVFAVAATEEAPAAQEEPSDGGLALPLRQLQLAAGVALLVLFATTT